MSNYRISAAMKDDIRKVYNRKIADLEQKIKQKSRILQGDYIDILNSDFKIEEFKSVAEKFYNWIEEVDSEGELVNYDLRRGLRHIVEGDKIFSLNSYHNYGEAYKDKDKEITDWYEEISRLEKEKNKIIWNIEMSPKTSNEYKEAIKKAEELLFDKE